MAWVDGKDKDALSDDVRGQQRQVRSYYTEAVLSFFLSLSLSLAHTPQYSSTAQHNATQRKNHKNPNDCDGTHALKYIESMASKALLTSCASAVSSDSVSLSYRLTDTPSSPLCTDRTSFRIRANGSGTGYAARETGDEAVGSDGVAMPVSFCVVVCCGAIVLSRFFLRGGRIRVLVLLESTDKRTHTTTTGERGRFLSGTLPHAQVMSTRCTSQWEKRVTTPRRQGLHDTTHHVHRSTMHALFLLD